MTTTDLPDPVVRQEANRVDVAALAAALRSRVDGEVRFDGGSRAAYSTDASNFRQVPIGVVLPRTPDAAAEAVVVAREHGAPVLSRGGGTSLCGQCCNVAVVIDFTKYLHRVLEIDPAKRREKVVLAGEIPSPLAPPPGCSFHTRCPRAQALCRAEEPQLRPMGGERMAACHFPLVP